MLKYLLALLLVFSGLRPASVQMQRLHYEPKWKTHLKVIIILFFSLQVLYIFKIILKKQPSAQSSRESGKSCTEGQNNLPAAPSVKLSTLHLQTKQTHILFTSAHTFS